MQYAMELFARARQTEMLREAEHNRISRGGATRDRRAMNIQPRLPEPRRASRAERSRPMRTTSQTRTPDGLVSAIAARVASARRWLAGGFNHAQLGPGREADWRSFSPRPR